MDHISSVDNLKSSARERTRQKTSKGTEGYAGEPGEVHTDRN